MSVDVRLDSLLRRLFSSERVRIDDDLSPETCEEWDSVATINMMFMIEEEFEIQFVGAKFLELSNVGAIRSYLHRVTV